MAHRPSTLACGARTCAPRWRVVAAALLWASVGAVAFMGSAIAQGPAASPEGSLPAADLEKLVGRIALYPDDLIAIILPAATSPLSLVQADRYLEKRKTDPKLPVSDKWDAAVKSLLNYPEIVKMMSSDLDWTTALGEAVVADQGAVLEAVQAFRRSAQAAGNLKSDKQQVVVVEKEVVRIVPADPQVIYVPQYSPSTVILPGGAAPLAYYPSPYPVYYYPYPPGAALATGLIWGAAIGAAWEGNHYVTHYGSGGSATININRNVNIGNVNIDTGVVGRPGAPTQSPAAGVTAWKPSRQTGQVGGTIGTTPAPRVGYAGSGGLAAPRASTQPVGPAPGATRPATQAAAAGGGAFGGDASGYQARFDSARGAASRSAVNRAGAGLAPSARPQAAGARRGGR